MRRIGILAILLLSSLLITGCVNIKDPATGVVGGIFKSTDGGEIWQQKVSLLSLSDQKETLNSVNVTGLVFDPQDSGTLYLSTKNNGAFVTFDAAESWERLKRLPLAKINSIVVHPLAKHIVYVAIDNQIFTSRDANRTWQSIYLESLDGVELTVLVIDPIRPESIMAGLSDGRMIKSDNEGLSWRMINDFKGAIKQILVNSNNNQVIYITTKGKGIFRSSDGGDNWQSLDQSLKDYRGGREVTKLIGDAQNENLLISINDYGILKTEDGGDTWSDYKLLVAGTKIKPQVLAINPQDYNIIYYAAAATLYKSIDGGQNWITKPLPSNKTPVELLIDPVNPSILYLGVGK
ncbi:hypothetical protein IID20_00495 [Patescibacteria group bacterium]|nr:hypothetical protein [Patescibacteria group bacterium]